MPGGEPFSRADLKFSRRLCHIIMSMILMGNHHPIGMRIILDPVRIFMFGPCKSRMDNGLLQKTHI